MNRRIARKVVKQALSGRNVNPHRFEVAVRLLARRGDSQLDLSPIAELFGLILDSFETVVMVMSEVLRHGSECAAEAARGLHDAIKAKKPGWAGVAS